MEILHMTPVLHPSHENAILFEDVDRFLHRYLGDHPEHRPRVGGAKTPLHVRVLPPEWEPVLYYRLRLGLAFLAPRRDVSDDSYPGEPLFFPANRNAVHII